MNSKRGVFRMSHWFIIGICFHIMAHYFLNSTYPQLSTFCWKMGNSTIAAYVGDWIGTHRFGHAEKDEMKVAVVMFGFIVGVTFGM